MKNLIFAAVLCAVVAALTLVNLASPGPQQAQIDPNAVPVEKEPQHHLVFTNDFVRVVDARFPPGYKSLSHAHAQDNVAVTISTGRDDAASAARIGRAGFRSIIANIMTTHIPANAKKLMMFAEPPIPSDMGTPNLISRPILTTS